jgi:hypothetical protein
MIIKVKSIPVGTGVIAGKVRRSFTSEMADLVEQYVEVVTVDDEWVAMREEFEGNKFIFHRDWVEVDRRRDSKKPIELKTGDWVVKTKGGILDDTGIKALDHAIKAFDKQDSEYGTCIKWCKFSDLVKKSPEWQVWNNGRPLDQRYKTYIMDKYGVAVPDVICMEIARIAKLNMSQQINGVVPVLKNPFGYGFMVQCIDVQRLGGWLVVMGGDLCPYVETAHAICFILGKDKYSYSPINIEGRLNCLCVHKTSERGALKTKVYKVNQ